MRDDDKARAIANGADYDEDEARDIESPQDLTCPVCGADIGFMCVHHPKDKSGPWPCACRGDPNHPRMGQCSCDIAVCMNPACGMPVTYQAPKKEKVPSPVPEPDFSHIFVSQFNPPTR